MTAEAVEHYDRIDILVNNVGVRPTAFFLEMDISSRWQRMLDVNLNGAMCGCCAVIPHMLEIGRGKIVNIASVAGILAFTKRSAYVASKGAIIGLTKALAFELSRDQIWVNAVAPGTTVTPMNAPYFADPAMLELLDFEMPIGRFGQPNEITSAVLLLASDEADFVCGETLVVDGGWTTGKGF
ncbi:MAG: SDR family oxidoreductase [Candidatus Limnocylindrales bacterium]|jgi:gluconate 5-dehydrogenase